MKKLKLPASVKIGPFVYRIEEMERRAPIRERCSGVTEHGPLLIRVQLDDFPAQVIAETLVHEIFHAIYWVAGVLDEDREERIVRQMATMWAAVMRDNPALVKWLADALK